MASRFLYHAYAVGVAGQITRPINHLIPSQAVSALPAAGGYSSSRQDAHHILELFSHAGASSEATGSQNPSTSNYETSVTATIQGLNIENVLLLDSCTAYLTSVHPAAGGQPPITAQGSFFQNLRIAGRTIELESRIDLYDSLNTLDKLRDRYRSDGGFRDRFLKEAFSGNAKALDVKQQKYFPWRDIKNTADLPVSKATGATVVPLFIVLNPSEPGFQVNGNVITVENFGTITLGELVIGGYERRLTMVHADLGSPIEGSISAADVGGNGSDTDPG